MDEETKLKVESFAEIVRRYCNWAENASKDSHLEMQTAQKLLSELNYFVLHLPDDEFNEVVVEVEDVSSEQWEYVRKRFSILPVDGYWSVFDPLDEEENSPVYGMLSDDLADIYQDIKYGLLLFDEGYFSEAIWEWKFKFNIHWGRHLLDAQNVIYAYFN